MSAQVIVIARRAVHLDDVPGLAFPVGVCAGYEVTASGRSANLALPVYGIRRSGICITQKVTGRGNCNSCQSKIGIIIRDVHLTSGIFVNEAPTLTNRTLARTRVRRLCFSLTRLPAAFRTRRMVHARPADRHCTRFKELGPRKDRRMVISPVGRPAGEQRRNIAIVGVSSALPQWLFFIV